MLKPTDFDMLSKESQDNPRLAELDVVHKKRSVGNRPGRPVDEIIMKLAVKYKHKVTRKPYWSCIAIQDGCRFLRSGNPQQNRILPHAARCKFLVADLKTLANETAARDSLGAKLANCSDPEPAAASNASEAMIVTAKRRKVNPDVPKPLPTPSKLEIDFTAAGTKLLQNKIDHCIMKLICVNGLVPNILDSENWAEVAWLGLGQLGLDRDPRRRQTNCTFVHWHGSPPTTSFPLLFRA